MKQALVEHIDFVEQLKAERAEAFTAVEWLRARLAQLVDAATAACDADAGSEDWDDLRDAVEAAERALGRTPERE